MNVAIEIKKEMVIGGKLKSQSLEPISERKTQKIDSPKPFEEDDSSNNSINK